MCLTNNPEDTANFLFHNQESIIAYKVLCKQKDHWLYQLRKEQGYQLLSPYYPQYSQDIWKPGTVYSNSTSTLSSYKENISQGIHVYLDQDAARSEAEDFEIEYNMEGFGSQGRASIVLKVICDPKHLLGVNGNRAVFSQVSVTEEHLKETINQDFRSEDRSIYV